MKVLIQKYHRILGIVFLLLALVGVGMMYRNNQQEQLWGYWTLLVFLGSWCGLVLLLWKSIFKEDALFSLWLKTSLSGILLGLSFPFLYALPTGFLALVAWVPLLQTIQSLRDANAKGKSVFFWSFNTFMLWNIIASYWVANSSFPAGIFAIAVNSALMCIPVLLYYRLQVLMPRLKWALLIAFWLCFEYMHFHWELNWPWLTFGNTMASMPALIQWYAYTGVLGGSLWLLLVNLSMTRLLGTWRDTAKRLKYLVQTGALLGIPILFSIFLYFNYEEQENEIQVTLMQPNVEPFYERQNIETNDFTSDLISKALKAAPGETDYFIYPEATLELVNQDDIGASRQVQQLQNGILRKHPDAKIIIGTDAYRFLGANESPTRYTRTRTRNGLTQYYEVYNAALEFGTEEEDISFYKKSKLVPGVEIFPYPQIFAFLKPLLESMGGTMAGRGAQKERAVFAGGKAKVAPAICYESVFGQHIAAHVRNGAQVIFIITNDAWWDETAGHIQHFHYARIRAIENRRSIARSANTGISGIINQRGDVKLDIKYGSSDCLTVPINLNDQPSFYSQNPGVIPRFALFAGLVFLLNFVVKSLIPKKDSA